ncbi:helix-turn-helix domain-containing protein [Sphingomonas parapaucimobilis]|uniref:helix-turn-helix domain-containing protein n=1 Tax=Sphingomonas parapaucimobilis TaxID=28213 RepID=UPI00321BC065
MSERRGMVEGGSPSLATRGMVPRRRTKIDPVTDTTGDFLSYGADSLRMAVRAFKAGGAPTLARRTAALLATVNGQASGQGASALPETGERHGTDGERSALARRIRERLSDMRDGPSILLARLMEEPDQFVTVDALMAAIETCSASPVIVKVYVCQARSALRREGMEDAITNARRQGYGLKGDAAKRLFDLLQA